MKIIHKDMKNGEIKFRITKLDDLWYLSHVIEPGDLLKGKTERKLELGQKGKKVKKTVFLEIKVDKVEYNQNVLRVAGIITQGPEDVERGAHHSFSLEEQSIASVVKEKFTREQIDKLDQAVKEREDILVLAFDRENATFAVLKATGYDVLAELAGEVEKKDYKTEVKDFYGQILEMLKEYISRYKINRVVVGSPSVWKQNFEKIVPDDLKKKIIWATCSTGQKKGVAEILKRDEIKKALKEDRISTEIRLVEDLLTEIKIGEKASYGIKDVSEKVNMGAAAIVIVTDTFLKKQKEEGKYNEVDELLNVAESTKAQIFIIKGDHEGGQKLDGLGGIGAILRYRVS
ncbi:mRNA surveillance protein pelota [Candidatus Woesearchaeota archaeon]|nr:mRNA surveillance protein pelota [Candidatus Woesearchaeota archaeon]